MSKSLAAIRSELLAQKFPIEELNANLASRTNSWLSDLFESNNKTQSEVALIALGGLGRNELTIGSDLDLLLLHTDSSAKLAADLAENLWYPIWDSGIGLDHSVRTIDQTLVLAQTDLRVMFGLLDQRFVAGELNLANQLNEQTFRLWQKTFLKRFDELVSADLDRHEKFGDLAHLQAPNLKECQGGLRDLVTLSAIAKSWQLDVGMPKLIEAKSLLLKTRSALHLAAGKSVDLLSLETQPDVAQIMGVKSTDELMSSIYRAARTINFSYQTAIRNGRYLQERRGWLKKRVQSRIPLADGVVLADNQIQLAINHTPDHSLLLRAAIASAQTQLQINPATLAGLTASEPEFVWDQTKRDLFISLLATGEGLIEAWEALDQSGAIAKMLPQWNEIRFAPQRNSVHKYTVDRHLIQSVVEASKLTTLVARPDILLMAALLHDIGKARDEDHSILGAQLAREITTNMGFSRLDCEVIELLVRHHLLLPETATKRDLSDAATIELVTDKIKSRYVLNLLHQLTIADAKATAPIASSTWRLSLIGQLVELTQRTLIGDEIPIELELTDDLKIPGNQIGLELYPAGDCYQVSISIPDSAGTLAKIAGLFSLHRLEVRSAKTKTIGKRVISRWQVAPLFGDAPAVEVLRNDLTQIISGGMDIGDKLASRENGIPLSANQVAPPRISFPQVNSDQTVIEVRAHDAPAILYRIANAISAQGLDITAAIVATLGATADDVFYVRNQAGSKLSEAEQAQVSEAILAAMSVG